MSDLNNSTTVSKETRSQADSATSKSGSQVESVPPIDMQETMEFDDGERGVPPAPTSIAPPTLRADHPGGRMWIYGIGFDDTFLDKWCTKNNFGPLDDPFDRDVAHSEFFSSLKATFLSRHGLPTTWCTNTYAGGYVPPRSRNLPAIIPVLWLTDNKLGSRAVDEIPTELIERYRQFMGVAEVTPMWYAKADD